VTRRFVANREFAGTRLSEFAATWSALAHDFQSAMLTLSCENKTPTRLF
jgi:hypothetical protein